MSANRIAVVVDRDLADSIPGFLSNRRKDIVAIAEALNQQNFPALQILGHKMRGSCGGYGFDGLGTIGSQLEEAAEKRDAVKIAELASAIEDYLSRIDISYED